MNPAKTRSIVALLGAGFMLAGILWLSGDPSTATELAVRPGKLSRQALPFPRSGRAQAVWSSGACWSECGSYCAWGLAGCLTGDRQGRCVKLTDACDRTCQRQCRTAGGPLLPLDF
jgi:hypothetical protein